MGKRQQRKKVEGAGYSGNVLLLRRAACCAGSGGGCVQVQETAERKEVELMLRFQEFSIDQEFPHQAPQPGGSGSRRRSPQSIWLCRPGGLIAGAPQDGEKQRLCSWRVYARVHAHWDPGQKQ